MSNFVSNAQNFEDIYLFRAYKYITNLEINSFEPRIVDIGAWEPIADNVSAFFIGQGWFANLLEPQPFYYDKLLQVYGDNSQVDISQVAVSSQSGETEIYIPDINTGWASLIKGHAEHMQEGINVLTVPTTTIDQIHGSLSQDYAILKIDAEENELNILKGWVQNSIKPLLICVEDKNFEIKHRLEVKGYKNFFFDGINMYFVLNDFYHLVSNFNPINLLEDNSFVLRPGTWIVNNDYRIKEL